MTREYRIDDGDGDSNSDSIGACVCCRGRSTVATISSTGSNLILLRQNCVISSVQVCDGVPCREILADLGLALALASLRMTLRLLRRDDCITVRVHDKTTSCSRGGSGGSVASGGGSIFPSASSSSSFLYLLCLRLRLRLRPQFLDSPPIQPQNIEFAKRTIMMSPFNPQIQARGMIDMAAM
ncbi:uncharacterized protein HMPREF1120_07120 [Exophiala dermatitidis NIH/UT8656]|uniref:Uncharacterized protein n=1 Tax=Exophiala dermatitidis (strain ATCC 34100 / CBS 525.76 / NIH/UT8656) TaxID=858893 RepID=H6C5X5_EXODN|nr:uncharacterized protein HMPREF1120_07120 [Exophiala dermatitidis NIH/UT8656]EHY59121.1 hypothetical protein HMPREF1120_07120 [Exophiala dermatitidis NIH/UT8656]